MQLVEALEHEHRSRTPIGRLALQRGKLDSHQLLLLLGEQIAAQRPFGEVAIELQTMSRRDVADLLMAQAEESRPLTTILLEMGVVDPSTLDEELTRYYQNKPAFETCAVD